ncbi:lipoyl(octanoyl) transferase LipB [bacterium]|nr:lipoyl(octanoyl) transferase LipB [bacterium]
MGAPAHTQLASKRLEIWDLGLEDYLKTYERQRAAVARAKEDPEQGDGLFFVEHPAVYTSGRRSAGTPVDPSLPLVEIERGGEMTFHNPGQLVAYPILRLQGAQKDLHAYLRNLEEVLIRVLGDFGLPGERHAGATGVWVTGREKKIASIGVAVSSWVTYHGTALNVCNDLSGFARINPCGFSADVMTSLAAELGGRGPAMDEAKHSYLRHFQEIFR